MKSIYQDILSAKASGKKLLAILLDPDKIEWNSLPILIDKILSSNATHILVGGSTVAQYLTDKLVEALKEQITQIPIVLFPGDFSQITDKADALLFLSLLSGRNPEYLIEQQLKAVPYLQATQLEIIPTSYILIDGGNQTAVARVSQTEPIPQSEVELIAHTAKAGEYLGHKLTYLEAGSGANIPVAAEIITAVSQTTTIPLIVGGGIRSQKQIDIAYQSGADMVVIGTAFEQNLDFFD
jgi:phosphoglycerol geranylgeranyltransferase